METTDVLASVSNLDSAAANLVASMIHGQQHRQAATKKVLLLLIHIMPGRVLQTRKPAVKINCTDSALL